MKMETVVQWYDILRAKAIKYFDDYQNTGRPYYLNKYHDYDELCWIAEKALLYLAEQESKNGD